MDRRSLILIGAIAALIVGGGAVAALLLRDDGSASVAVAEAPLEWTGPVRAEVAGAGVATLDTGEDGSLVWSEAPDTAPAWADVRRIGIVPDFQNWRLELGLDHPRREALSRADQILAFGFVMDTNADGVADYVVGIDNNADDDAVHVWLTNMATGDTDERFSGPYGDPFDFSTSFENEPPDGPRRPSGGSFFNVGFAPPELFDFETTRFYAWSSLTEAGDVVAWDYAPDRGWIGAPQRDRVGCTPIACPMTGPEPGPGAREWIVTVENQSARDAHLFVAMDTSPMGDLVGTATPASIPAGASQQVVLAVPAGTGWAIFVNPSPTMGPLIGAQDVPEEATGVLPITIYVQAGGMASVSVPPGPGWFGN